MQIISNCVFASATSVAFLIGYLRQIGFNEIQIAMYGVIIGFAGLFNILGAWVSLSSGNLKKVYLSLATISTFFCLAGIIISYISSPLNNDVMPIVILVFFLFWQVLLYMSVPPILSWLHNLVGTAGWGSFFSTRMMISDIAILVTSLAAGVLLGGNPMTSRFLLIFLISSLFALLGIFFMSKVPSAILEHKTVSFKSFLRIFQDSIKRKIFRFLLAVIFLRAFAYGLIMPFQPVFLLEKMNLDYTMIAVMINLSLIFAIGTYKIWARIQIRFGNYTSLKWSIILSVLTPFLWILGSPSQSLFIYMAFVLVGLAGNSGIAGAGYYTSCISMIFEYAGDEDKPIYTSLYFFATGLASSIAPAVGGVLLKHFNQNPFQLPFLNVEFDGYRLIFAVAGILLLITILFLPFIKANTNKTS